MKANSFWSDRFKQNCRVSLPYQWKKYEQLGTIDNFRVAASLKSGSRRGFFYTDSDLHKWADAVCRTLTSNPDSSLEELVNKYILLMKAAQDDDGYLYTFNQINFPGRRWENLLIEHELYCHGHFIEAGIEHSLWTGENTLLDLAEKSAALICSQFNRTKCFPGHQEVELALLRLAELCGNIKYKETALNFIYNRGRNKIPAYHLIKDFSSHLKKIKQISKNNSENQSFSIDDADLPGISARHKRRNMQSYLNGQYMQRHKPVCKQIEPVGHAVRWAYQMTAAALSGKEDLFNTAVSSWRRMISTKMYVSGGVGAMPLIEGFGKHFELPNDTAYCETCAAIGSIFLADKLFSSTSEALYMDVLDWQLYNAALVGMGADGKSYFYANPLSSNGGVERKSWFDTACCPSNLSRLLGSLHRTAVQEDEQNLFINLYIDGEYRMSNGSLSVNIKSSLPWEGDSKISIKSNLSKDVCLNFRIPGWVDSGQVEFNGRIEQLEPIKRNISGLPDFESAYFFPVTLKAGQNYEFEVHFDMPVKVLSADSRIKGNRGRIAVHRGPILYCIEYDKNISEELVILTESLEYMYDSDVNVGIIKARLQSGESHKMIPYFTWGNSGNPEDKKMRVWIKSS